ncbi:desulfoferrodoxin [Chitinispirillum alkaliphilum]|nr:desulfoferrodoxin [Chitinispirillum alkaliphilum]
MIRKKSIYKCGVCGNVVESLWNGKPSIVCCGQEMNELVANTVDAAVEKHVPVIEREGKKVTVKVGEAAHPMTSEHYILFVELLVGEDKVLRHDFKEGDTVAEAVFFVEEGVPVKAREFCNLHGLWATA